MPTTDKLNTLLAHFFLSVLAEDAPWAGEVVEDCADGDPHMVDVLHSYCKNLTSDDAALSPLPTSGDME